MKNTFNDSDDDGDIETRNIRGSMRWVLSDRLEADFISDFQDIDKGNANKRYLEGPHKTSAHEVVYNKDGFIEQDGNGNTLKLKYLGDGFKLLSVSGIRNYINHMVRDADCSPFDMGINDLRYDNSMMSQEFRAFSSESQKIEWLCGLYFFREENNIDIDLQGLGEIRNTELEYNGYAGFGEVTWNPTDKTHITAGLRYDRIFLEGDQELIRKDFKTGFEDSFDEAEILPKISASFDLSDEFMVYALASKGFLAGGYNTAFAENSGSFTYDPEYTLNYETGFKFSSENKKYRVNLALFYIDISDKQVTEVDEKDGVVTDLLRVKNAADAHSIGGELELYANPFDNFELFAGYGYTKAVFDNWTAVEKNKKTGSISYYDYEDKSLPNAPEHTLNLGFQYRNRLGLIARTDILQTGDFYSDAKNGLEIDGYTLVNLKFGYESENYDLIFWGKNIFNEEYQTVKFDRKKDSCIDGDPRSFGIRLNYRF